MSSALLWDERLISQAEAYALAGSWPVHPAARTPGEDTPVPGRLLWWLDCGSCGQAMLALGDLGNPFTVTTDTIASAVLRHMVMAHNVTLGRNRARGRGDSGRPGRAAPGRRRGGDSGPVADPAGDRQPDQETGRDGGAAAAGGDRA